MPTAAEGKLALGNNKKQSSSTESETRTPRLRASLRSTPSLSSRTVERLRTSGAQIGVDSNNSKGPISNTNTRTPDPQKELSTPKRLKSDGDFMTPRGTFLPPKNFNRKAISGTPQSPGHTPSTINSSQRLAGRRNSKANVAITIENSEGQDVEANVSVKLGTTPMSRQINTRHSFSAKKSSMNSATPTLPNTPLVLHRRSHNGYLNTPKSSETSHRRSGITSTSHDAIKDESSTVSVGVRIRPLNAREKAQDDAKVLVDAEGNDIHVTTDTEQTFVFSYDSCFSSIEGSANFSSQKDVYEEMAKPLLEHAFEGYNVCLFAYGQTGSGKSYCIMGENADMLDCNRSLGDEVGIIPRFCHDLFEKVAEVHAENETKETKCHIVTDINYIEIYNEKIYDLIGWQPSIADCGTLDDKREPLRVREHPQKGPVVVGASSHLVTSYQDVHTWLMLGNQQRSIAATAMNDKSSRSHSVFSITLTRTMVETIGNESMEHSIISKINIVDLAGSERIGSSFHAMDRLKEGVCINKSLLTLGKVITALAENPGKKKNFIPYRDSVLTWLLKESLGGNSKTSMIATISPCNFHQEETLSTLRYAQQARKIVNWNHINEDPTATMIRNLKLELERLRAKSLGSPTRLDFNSSLSDAENSDSENVPPNNKLEEERRLQEEALERQRIEGLAELEVLKTKLRNTQLCLTERTEEYERKLREANEQKKDALEMCRMSGLALKIEDNQPALVNLCEDPQLSQTLMYTLKKGDTTLGQSKADVSLANLHENNIHCTICNKDGSLFLFPNSESKTYVNGKLVTTKTEIYHNDRIVLSGIYYFRVNWPQKRTNSTQQNIDFFYVRNELLKEQEERIKRDLEERLERDKAEMLRQVEELQQQANQMQTVTEELESERAEAAKIKLAQLKLQEENMFLQQQNRLEDNFADISVFNPEQSDMGSDFFLEMDNILDQTRQTVDHDVSQITVNDLESWFIVTEANGLCSKLKKPYEFNLQSQLVGDGIENFILAKDKDHDLVAMVSPRDFKQIVQVLRDLASGMQEEDGTFESYFEWKREQDMSMLPSVINKIKQNHKRYSMNSSFNGSTMGPPPPKKLSIGKRINSRAPSCSVNIAKAVCAALDSTKAVAPNHSVCETAVSSICHLLDILQSFRPGSLELIDLEEEVGTLLVRMAVSSQAVSTAMSRMTLVTLPQACKKANDFHETFAKSGLKVTRLVQRISKGFQTETLALAIDESKHLSSFLSSLMEEIGYVCVLGDCLVREPFELCARYHSFCQLYLIGVTKGLEWQLSHTNKSAKNAAVILSSSFENSPRDALVQKIESKAKKAATSIAVFLDTFSSLNVSINLDSNKTAETSATEAMRFLYRVKLASDNFKQVTSSLANITMEFQKMDGRPNAAVLKDSVCALEESLRELIEDAGIGPSYDKNSADSSTDSTKSLLDSLGTLAIQTVRSLQGFASSIDQFDSKTKFVRPQKRSSDHTPFKSSLKTSSKEGENKKVRFESVSSKCFED